jgi:hypothetical protein
VSGINFGRRRPTYDLQVVKANESQGFVLMIYTDEEGTVTIQIEGNEQDIVRGLNACLSNDKLFSSIINQALEII